MASSPSHATGIHRWQDGHDWGEDPETQEVHRRLAPPGRVFSYPGPAGASGEPGPEPEPEPETEGGGGSRLVTALKALAALAAIGGTTAYAVNPRFPGRAGRIGQQLGQGLGMYAGRRRAGQLAQQKAQQTIFAQLAKERRTSERKTREQELEEADNRLLNERYISEQSLKGDYENIMHLAPAQFRASVKGPSGGDKTGPKNEIANKALADAYKEAHPGIEFGFKDWADDDPRWAMSSANFERVVDARGLLPEDADEGGPTPTQRAHAAGNRERAARYGVDIDDIGDGVYLSASDFNDTYLKHTDANPTWAENRDAVAARLSAAQDTAFMAEVDPDAFAAMPSAKLTSLLDHFVETGSVKGKLEGKDEVRLGEEYLAGKISSIAQEFSLDLGEVEEGIDKYITAAGFDSHQDRLVDEDDFRAKVIDPYRVEQSFMTASTSVVREAGKWKNGSYGEGGDTTLIVDHFLERAAGIKAGGGTAAAKMKSLKEAGEETREAVASYGALKKLDTGAPKVAPELETWLGMNASTRGRIMTEAFGPLVDARAANANADEIVAAIDTSAQSLARHPQLIPTSGPATDVMEDHLRAQPHENPADVSAYTRGLRDNLDEVPLIREMFVAARATHAKGGYSEDGLDRIEAEFLGSITAGEKFRPMPARSWARRIEAASSAAREAYSETLITDTLRTEAMGRAEKRLQTFIGSTPRGKMQAGDDKTTIIRKLEQSASLVNTTVPGWGERLRQYFGRGVSNIARGISVAGADGEYHTSPDKYKALISAVDVLRKADYDTAMLTETQSQHLTIVSEMLDLNKAEMIKEITTGLQYEGTPGYEANTSGFWKYAKKDTDAWSASLDYQISNQELRAAYEHLIELGFQHEMAVRTVVDYGKRPVHYGTQEEAREFNFNSLFPALGAARVPTVPPVAARGDSVAVDTTAARGDSVAADTTAQETAMKSEINLSFDPSAIAGGE